MSSGGFDSSLSALSITELRDAQQNGSLTAVEIAENQLAALDETNSVLNAVVEWQIDRVLEQTRIIDDARRRGDALGPLAGVPVTVKDSFDVAGLNGSVGVPSSRHLAHRDSPSVALLRTAGAVVLGKTNVPPYLDASDTDNELYGRTLNPWSAHRTPGGSSGGSAAAVSSGLSWGDLGSDLAGSIRVPASWCGVFGHRPSTGIISKRGHLPWPTGARLDPPTSTAGPLARSAADLHALFSVLAAPEHPEARIWRLELPEPRFGTLAGIRIGVWRNEPSAPVDDETSEAFDELVGRLAAEGCITIELTQSVLATAEAEMLFGRLIDHEISFSAAASDSRLDEPASSSAGAPISQVWADWDAQRRLRDRWESQLDDHAIDIVLAPVTPSVAPLTAAVADSGTRVDINGRSESLKRIIGRWSCMSNLSMGPSTTIPIALGTASGMPVGAQAIARFGDDLSTLAFAEHLELRHVIPRLSPPPLGASDGQKATDEF